jgi:lactate dehydrogenase-like 2-hydroxyacid dehydrogenase
MGADRFLARISAAQLSALSDLADRAGSGAAALGFGMRILYTAEDGMRSRAGLWRAVCDLNTLLLDSDFVSLHTTLSPVTHHLMNEERFAR